MDGNWFICTKSDREVTASICITQDVNSFTQNWQRRLHKRFLGLLLFVYMSWQLHKCTLISFCAHFCMNFWLKKKAFHFEYEIFCAFTKLSLPLFFLFRCAVSLFISNNPLSLTRWIYNKHLWRSAIQGCLGVPGMHWKKSSVQYFGTFCLATLFLSVTHGNWGGMDIIIYSTNLAFMFTCMNVT